MILSTLYLVLCTKFVHAQAPSANQAYQDYQNQLTTYDDDYANYQSALTFYKKDPTLQLQEAARQSTLTMLKDRDLLVVVYLTALRSQIAETTGFTDDQKNAIYGKIDLEVVWYQTHITSYQITDDLPTLFTRSGESSSRYTTQTHPIIYESLFDISLSEEIGLRMAHQAIYNDLQNYINSLISQGKITIDPFTIWLNDTNNVLSTLNQNESLATGKISNLYTQNYSLNQTYNSGVLALSNSTSPLMQLNNYLTEMLTTIQNQTQ